MKRLHTHYDNLKIARNAPPEVIKAAYKSLSVKFHPDRNPGDAEAARIMRIINCSYAVLSDPDKRRRHDLWIERREREMNAESRRTQTPPSDTTKRYHDEPEQSAPQYSTDGASEAPGFTEMETTISGSKILREPAFYITFLVALSFVLPVLLYEWLNSPEIAQQKPAANVAYSGLQVPMKAGFASQKQTGSGPANANAVTTSPTPTKTNQAEFADVRPSDGPTKFVVTGSDSPGDSSSNKAQSADPEPTPRSLPGKASSRKREPKRYVRPTTAPNGYSWPNNASYLYGYPILNSDGYSEIIIDNSRNDSDVYVKLFYLEPDEPYAVRNFYIPAYGGFTLQNVRAGSYDIRYLNLNTGSLSRSQSFDLIERETDYSVRYSSLTITLYKVVNGNFKTYPITEDDFY